MLTNGMFGVKTDAIVPSVAAVEVSSSDIPIWSVLVRRTLIPDLSKLSARTLAWVVWMVIVSKNDVEPSS